MNELALRLAAVDPEAGAAVRVIGHFDALVAARAGLRTIVAGAATLSGRPARLSDTTRHLTIRATPDGIVETPPDEFDPAWPSASIGPGATLWLETTAAPSTHEAVVLERAAAAVRAVLERTRSAVTGTDAASVELVLDPHAALSDRLSAARRLGLPPTARAVALADGEALILPPDAGPPAGRRAGVGPCSPVADLPASWTEAQLALRLTAEGTEADPGPRVVHADDLGTLALLIRAADTTAGPVPDVEALNRAATAAPWALHTLDTLAGAPSMRDAARALRLHHSTLQERIKHLEALLGWPIRDPHGRFRLHLALAIRRALRRP
ncbi:helix-turn-helix domain-containing protein [Actinoplanes sp. Pm04-4]|uniref:Helix-turn-helix domain-containing protein n=1 Tax=Paractinoplanes pyxinae TaxID=2997416 RepID=A0ABT4ATY0_9ACTN|nr:helix-turn-helix domain-containing protein [Actinoplanes pyxinae]MCY1137140.1 helix-turn-helix domain-containing protein [Actinoplanes pyxinae]